MTTNSTSAISRFMAAKTLKRVIAPLLMSCMAVISQIAYAQSVSIPSAASLVANTPSTDMSVSIFTSLLGNFFTNPLSAVGGPTSLIGNMFMVFNSAVFVIGMLWAGYGLLSGIAETANTGEVLGKRLSAVWLPIRMVTGIVGIVPVFAGFSLSQVLIVTMTAIGIGLANSMTLSAITSVNNFANLTAPSAASAAGGGVDFNAAAHNLFRMHVCRLSKQKIESENVSHGNSNLPNESIRQFVSNDPTTGYSLGWGTTNVSNMCGTASVRKTGDGNPPSINIFGTTVNSINYSAYANQVAQAYTSGLQTFDQNISRIATTWFNQRNTKNATAGSTVEPYPDGAIEGAAQTYAQSVQTTMTATANSARASSDSALGSKAINSMTKDGWLGIGAWFMTFAEGDAAMASAMKAVSFEYTDPNMESLPGFVVADLQAIQVSAQASTTGNISAGADTTANSSEGWNWAEQLLCKTYLMPSACTATGNFSLGQAIIKQAIDVAAVGSGGGAGGGVFGSSTGLVNPITMFKNMGDILMNIGTGLYTIKAMSDMDATDANAGKDVTSKFGGALIKKMGSLATGPITSIAIKAIGKIANMLMIIAPYIVILGLLMGIYIPMIPFITWMGAVVQYFVVVCQGIVGAPIAALSHLEAEGDGLGRRTEAGYMFALNVTFRPALMLFGFFLASSLMIALGTFQARIFLVAMANAQGNSITGFLSIIGFLTVFFIMNVTLIQGLFNMIFLLPDQVLGLIGTSGAMTDIGKETEGKMHNTFMAVGRSGQAMAGAGSGRLPPKLSKEELTGNRGASAAS